MASLEYFTVTANGVGAIGIDYVDAGTDPDESVVYAFVDFVPRLPHGTVIWAPDLDTPRGVQLDRVRGRFDADGVLRTIVGEALNEKQRVTITGAPTGGTFTLTYAGQTTAPIAYNVSPAGLQTALEALSNIAPGDVFVSGAVVNERQTVTVTGTGGTFTLTFDGQTTSSIPFGATKSQVSATLQALSNIEGGSITVTGPDGGPYVVEFIGSLAGQNMPEMTGAGAAANERQRVTIGGQPTAGTFTLTYAGQTTAGIAYNASAANVLTALEALSNIGVGDVAVEGNGPYTVTFQGALAATNVTQMTGNPAGLTGGTTEKTVSVTTLTVGAPAPTVGVVTTQPGSTEAPFTVSFTGVLKTTNVTQMTANPAGLTGGTSPNVTVTTLVEGTLDAGVKLVANTPVIAEPLSDLGVDTLIYDVEFTIPESERVLNPFAIAAPTTGGGTVDLASVTKLPPRDPGTF